MVRFGTRSLLITTVLVAIGIPAFVFPGGIFLFLPILLLFLLSIAFVILWFNWRGATSRGPIHRQLPLLAVALAMLAVAITLVLLFDVAWDQYSKVRFNDAQRARALKIPDLEGFRDKCLELHTILKARSGSERVLYATSHEVPQEIRAINPISITASDDFISIQVTRDGGAIVAYPLDGSFPHVRSRKLTDCLYYWPD